MCFFTGGIGCANAGTDIYLSAKNIHIFGKYRHIAGNTSDNLLIFVGMQVDILCDRFYTYKKAKVRITRRNFQNAEKMERCNSGIVRQ